MALPAAAAACIRTAVARAGVGFLLAGALLAGATALLVLTAPGGNSFLGAMTVAGGTTGGLLVVLAGIGLLDARQVVAGEYFLIGRARRVRRLLLLLFVLTVVIGGMCAYGMLSIDEGPVAASPQEWRSPRAWPSSCAKSSSAALSGSALAQRKQSIPRLVTMSASRRR